MDESKYTKQLLTRVTPEVWARLKGLEDQYGISIFNLLRMLADCLVRFMDSDTNLSEDLLRIIRMFEGLPGWRKSICLADGLEDMEIVEAFYVLRQPRRDGYRLVWVERPVMSGDADGWMMTFNVQRILERFMELINPSLYMHLRRLGVDLGTESMLDTIHTIANLYKANPDEEELRIQFENNNWHKGGQADQDVRYQTRKFHTADYNETHHPTLFENQNENENENE